MLELEDILFPGREVMPVIGDGKKTALSQQSGDLAQGLQGPVAMQIGRGLRLIAKREGSYSNVVGLPRRLVRELLERSGWEAPRL